jgi:hypothetical protein
MAWARDLNDPSSLAKTETALRESEILLYAQMEAFQAAIRGAPFDLALGILARTAVGLMGCDGRCGFYLVSPTGSSQITCRNARSVLLSVEDRRRGTPAKAPTQPRGDAANLRALVQQQRCSLLTSSGNRLMLPTMRTSKPRSLDEILARVEKPVR